MISHGQAVMSQHCLRLGCLLPESTAAAAAAAIACSMAEPMQAEYCVTFAASPLHHVSVGIIDNRAAVPSIIIQLATVQRHCF
jgi:hypothetical protein